MTLRHGGAASKQAEDLQIELGERVRVGGEDVTEAIRAPEVSEAASRVATNPAVRGARLQAASSAGERRLGGRGPRHRHGGGPRRSGQGLPHREPEERARRRAAELGTDVETVLRDQALRDAQDESREHSPLAVAWARWSSTPPA